MKTVLAYAFMVMVLLFVPEADAASGNSGPLLVEMDNGLLTVKAREESLGRIMDMISMKTGIDILVSPEVSNRTLSTDFSKMELQKGVQRLLSLLNMKNYFIYYGADGSINKIEIHGETVEAEKSSPARQPRRRPTVNRRRRPVRPQTRRAPQRPQMPQMPPSQQPDIPGQFPPGMMPGGEPMPPGMEPMMVNPGEPVPPDYIPGREGMPQYIPPARVPAYIPPRPENEH